jgi:sugar phosphate isomerase/epimerase
MVPYAAHAHVSEPDLAPVGSTGADHHSVSGALRKSGYAGSLSIEMKQTSDWPSALRRAVSFTRETYCDERGSVSKASKRGAGKRDHLFTAAHA